MKSSSRLLKQTKEEKDALITELKDALSGVKRLQGIIPICSSCKKVRDGEGYRHQVEAYMSAHSDARFSHSLCEECIKIIYPEEYVDLKKNKAGC